MQFISQWWLAFAFGIVGTAITVTWKKVKAVSRGMRALLKDRIVQAYNHYKDKEYFPIYARETVQDLYDQYHTLGGNGTITHLFAEIRELPTEKPDNNKKEITK